MALGEWLDPFERTDVNHKCLVLGHANGVQSIAVLGPLEAEALDIFTGNSRGEGADHFLADHAQQTGMFVTFVDAVAVLPGRSAHEAFFGRVGWVRRRGSKTSLVASSSSWVHSPLLVSGSDRMCLAAKVSAALFDLPWGYGEQVYSIGKQMHFSRDAGRKNASACMSDHGPNLKSDSRMARLAERFLGRESYRCPHL